MGVMKRIAGDRTLSEWYDRLLAAVAREEAEEERRAIQEADGIFLAEPKRRKSKAELAAIVAEPMELAETAPKVVEPAPKAAKTATKRTRAVPAAAPGPPPSAEPIPRAGELARESQGSLFF